MFNPTPEPQYGIYKSIGDVLKRSNIHRPWMWKDYWEGCIRYKWATIPNSADFDNLQSQIEQLLINQEIKYVHCGFITCKSKTGRTYTAYQLKIPK